MKIFSKKYNERAIKMERYVFKNRLFFIMVPVVIALLITTTLNKNNESVNHNNTENVAVTEEVDTDINSKELPPWRFYSIDAWILGVGGTVCVVNILRERKKAKEKLQ